MACCSELGCRAVSKGTVPLAPRWAAGIGRQGAKAATDQLGPQAPDPSARNNQADPPLVSKRMVYETV
jgi:hypothetical protein